MSPPPRAAWSPRPPLDSSSGLREKTPGTTFLGRYRLVDEIGSGGMASVHLARLDGIGGFRRWVAVKRIHPHLVENEQFVDMFLDEARTAAGISHANVALVFDVGRDEDTYWIAMEYLHGETLREVQRGAESRGVRLPPELAARICADAAEGLHAAHELRDKNGRSLDLVHRDVTPHNLFMTYDGATKVVDFGIAKVKGRLAARTHHGTLKGKLAYMSPEQLRGEDVDRRTDVFALGVVLWELTTQRRLFRGDTDLETLERVSACAVPPPSTIVPGYPAELERCVLRALAPRKEDRYPTAREFSRDLQRYLLRTGHFIGPEEVSTFVRAVLGDEMRKREAHLLWADEATSAGRVEPPSGTRPVADLLMEDDDDLPTTIATRESLEAQDLGATVALPAGFVPPSAPTFEQHLRPAPAAVPNWPAPVFGPAPALPAVRRCRYRALVPAIVLAVIGLIALGAVAARRIASPPRDLPSSVGP